MRGSRAGARNGVVLDMVKLMRWTWVSPLGRLRANRQPPSTCILVIMEGFRCIIMTANILWILPSWYPLFKFFIAPLWDRYSYHSIDKKVKAGSLKFTQFSFSYLAMINKASFSSSALFPGSSCSFSRVTTGREQSMIHGFCFSSDLETVFKCIKSPYIWPDCVPISFCTGWS